MKRGQQNEDRDQIKVYKTKIQNCQDNIAHVNLKLINNKCVKLNGSTTEPNTSELRKKSKLFISMKSRFQNC